MAAVVTVLVWAVLCADPRADVKTEMDRGPARVLLPENALREDGWRARRAASNGMVVEAFVPNAPHTQTHTRKHPGFAVGWSFVGQAAGLSLRAGYRRGFDVLEHLETPVVLTSGGTLELRAGTVAQVLMDLEGFHEIEGTRRVRLDAVPGVRIRPRWPLRATVGVGVAVSVRQVTQTHFERHYAALLQLSSPLQ